MEETQALVVDSHDGKVTASVKNKSSVVILPSAITEQSINARMADIESVLTGNVDDPTMKDCSKCKKEGRIASHPVSNFSIIKKTGKLCSQCKKCKADAATVWCKSKAEHRRLYHQGYRADQKVSGKSGLKKLQEAQVITSVVIEDNDYPAEIQGRKHLETLYAAFNGNNAA